MKRADSESEDKAVRLQSFSSCRLQDTISPIHSLKSCRLSAKTVSADSGVRHFPQRRPGLSPTSSMDGDGASMRVKTSALFSSVG